MSARLVRRRMDRQIDPLALYLQLAGDEGRIDTAFFESPDGTTLLLDRAAVRAECRGARVRLDALNPNGEALLASVRGRLPVEPEVATGSRIELVISPSDAYDLEESLLAPAPLHTVRALLAAAAAPRDEPFAALAFGVVSFEHGLFGEVAIADPGSGELPDYTFWIADSLVLYNPGAPPQLLCAAFGDDEHQHDAGRRLERLVTACEKASPSVPAGSPYLGRPAFEADMNDADFAALVRRLQREIAVGELFQVVPSRSFRAPCPNPLRAFAALRAAEPNSYRFYVQGDDYTLLGASPESSVRLFREERALTVEMRPIAGTRARGADPDADERLEAELRLDTKELAEHMMLVDLARNDIARVSVSGTCRVARLLDVERHARVMHLVSRVTGRLAIGLDAFDALASCLNVGTLSGAPKIRASQLLVEIEATRRGPYGGAIGWIDGAGLMDTAVVIRSALVRNGTAFVRAGAGVVHDSVPEAEAAETRRKAEAMLAVLAASAERVAA